MIYVYDTSICAPWIIGQGEKDHKTVEIYADGMYGAK